MIQFERGKGYAPTASTEYGVMVRPRWNRNGRSGVLFAHFYGGTSAVAFDPLYGPPSWEVTQRGMMSFWGDLGGINQWGNDAAIARMDDSYDYLTAAGADEVVGLASYSMGTHQVLAWAAQNPEKVNAIALMLPTPGLLQTHDDYSALAFGIDLAYTDHAGYLAALPDHDYVNFIAQLDGIPIRIYADYNDPFYLGNGATPPYYPYILDQVSSADMVLFNGGGHTLDGLDPELPAEFLQDAAVG